MNVSTMIAWLSHSVNMDDALSLAGNNWIPMGYKKKVERLGWNLSVLEEEIFTGSVERIPGT